MRHCAPVAPLGPTGYAVPILLMPPSFPYAYWGSERAWGAAPRPSQSSPGRNMKASQASVVVLWPRNQPSTARNAVLAPTPRKFSFVGAILGGCAPSSARPRRARRPRGACEANHREQRVPSGGVVIGGQCRATWWGNSAARARRCPKKSAAWRRTFAVLATFPETCCHQVLGRGRDVPRMPLPSACPQRTPSGHAHTQQRAAAACRPLRLAFVAAAAFILAVEAGNPSGRPMPCCCTIAAISSDSRVRRGVY